MSFEQHPQEKKYLDIINDPSASTYARAHAASDLAHNIRHHRKDYAQALSYGVLAQQLFEKIHDDLNIADSLYSQGESHLGLKSYGEAMTCYDKAGSIFRTELNQRMLAHICDRKASCLEELDQPQQAAEGYLEASNLWVAIEDWNAAGMSSLKSAQELIKVKQTTEAELRVTQALDYFDQAENETWLADVYLARALALAMQKNYEAAESDVLEGLSVALYQDSTQDIAALNDLLAEIYLEQQRFDDAVFAVNRAKEANESIRNAKGLAECDLMLAQIFEKQGLLREAVEKLEACRTLVGFADPENGFEADWLLAKIKGQLGDLDSAVSGYHKAEKTLQTLKYAAVDADNFYIEFAELLLQTPNHAGALGKLDQVAFVENLEPLELVRYHALRARAHWFLGHHDQALEVADLALAAIEGDTNHPFLGSVLETKARTLCDRGDLEHGLAVMQNAINAHIASGSADSARYLVLELRNLSNPKADQPVVDSSVVSQPSSDFGNNNDQPGGQAA